MCNVTIIRIGGFNSRRDNFTSRASLKCEIDAKSSKPDRGGKEGDFVLLVNRRRIILTGPCWLRSNRSHDSKIAGETKEQIGEK